MDDKLCIAPASGMTSSQIDVVVIRPVSEADISRVQAIESEAFTHQERVVSDRIADSRRRIGGPWFVPTFVDTAVLSTRTNDMITGYVAWSYEPFAACEKCIHVMNLAVATEFRRLGIATRLLHHVRELSWQKFPRALCMRLIVRSDNAAAQALYQQFGFQQTEVHPKYYDQVDGIELQLHLDGPAPLSNQHPARTQPSEHGNKRVRRSKERGLAPRFQESSLAQDPSALNEFQARALSDMRRQIQPSASSTEDKELLRFLVARKWQVDAAVDQFQDGRLGRQGVEMFPQLRLVEPTLDEGALLFYGQTLAFGFDKKGQPVQIQNGGLAGWRFSEMLRLIGGSEKVLASLVRMHELQAARMEEASRKHGHPITKQVVITNADGMPLRPHPLAVAAFKDFLVVSSRYYPESLAVLFVVNAPPVFVALYRLIKTWLDPVTASKIQVLGRNFQPVLLEHIDADQLPRDYGGTVDFDILGDTWSEQENHNLVIDLDNKAQKTEHQRSRSLGTPESQSPKAFACLKKGTRAQLKFQGIQRPPFLYPTLLEVKGNPRAAEPICPDDGWGSPAAGGRFKREYLHLLQEQNGATDFSFQKVNLMTPEMSVQKHAKKLTKRISWGNWHIPRTQRCQFVFSQIASDGISLRIIIDTAFDCGLKGDSNALMELMRHAVECGHQLVIVTHSHEVATEIDNLNGVRTKITPQQDGKRAEDFRQSEDLAHQYLNREWLDATKMRDGPGGWSMRGYLSLGEAPPTRGRLRDVWRSARLCRSHHGQRSGSGRSPPSWPKEESEGEDELEPALKVSFQDHPRLNDVNDLKTAIQQTSPDLKDISPRLELGNASKTNRKSCVRYGVG
ncbi:SEC14 [Symbiodinium microadriaticum]|nr:SEC14 [Symbiodinium microadriaticum]